jgi:hypothetical protein
MASTLNEGWTGSVVWPGTEFLASEEGLRRWAWGGQVEGEGVPVHPTNLTSRGKRRVEEEGLRRWAWGGQVEERGVLVHPTNITRRGKRRVVEEEGPQDTFSSKEAFQTQVTR